MDEADLMALMEDGKPKEEPPAVCRCTKKCEAGAVNTGCPVCVTDKSKCTGKTPEPQAEAPEPEKEKTAGLNPAALILLLALLGGGGVFAVFVSFSNRALKCNISPFFASMSSVYIITPTLPSDV